MAAPLLVGVVLLLAAIPTAAYFTQRQHQQQFLRRERLSPADIFRRHYIREGWSNEVFCARWNAMAKVLHFPADCLRPTDRLIDLVSTTTRRLWGARVLDDLEHHILVTTDRHAPDPARFETIDEVIRYLCAHGN